MKQSESDYPPRVLNGLWVGGVAALIDKTKQSRQARKERKDRKK